MKKRHPHKANVLLVNITRLGDMLQATPTIAGIKEENPSCRITVLVEKQFESICHSLPGVDEVLSLDLGMTVRSLAREQDGIIDAYEYVDEIVRDLRSRRFDYCLNMSSSAYTALLLRLVGVERNGGWVSDAEGYRIIESDWARLFATSVFHRNRQFSSFNLVDVFRCSADVEEHPHRLLMDVCDADRQYCNNLMTEAAFTNDGPLIALQAGASQVKRQWAPERFARYIKIMTEEHNARIVMSGSKKELPLIAHIARLADSKNVCVAAGRTNIGQLGALLEMAELLITGDTGPMHISVAVGTPVLAMFLASAFSFETGPYSEGNLVLQPMIACAPCNPNKPCARPDCHDTITPELLAALTQLRLQRDVRELPPGFADPGRLIIYRSTFDRYGFLDFVPLNGSSDNFSRYRYAYRKLWLDEIGGYQDPYGDEPKKSTSLAVLEENLEGLEEVVSCAERGKELIGRLRRLILDESVPPVELGVASEELSALDRRIESIGFHIEPLSPLTRMFIFAKENLSGSDPLELASQMGGIYDDLARRSKKFSRYFANTR